MNDNELTDERLDALAMKLIKRMRDNDAWLCSIPHGQFETYTSHSKDRAEGILRAALSEEMS